AGYLKDFSFLDRLSKEGFRSDILQGRLGEIETIFHLGACSSTTETDADYLRDNNFQYTRDLCEWCLANEARFIYASSAATYGDGSLGYSDADEMTPRLKPLNLYGQSKQDFDLCALQQGWLNRIVGLKYFNVFGPREDHKEDMRSVVHKSFHQIRETGQIQLFKSHRPEYEDGKQERDFVYVKDAVEVTLYFADHLDRSGLFNCGTGEARSWLDLANGVYRAMEIEPDIAFIDMPEKLRGKYQYHTQAEVSKLREAGYTEPFTRLEDGIADYVASWLNPGAS
ncbi:MAG: ADP-glyceromanno-heptose 6-epimerase, partial [Verrucomicrobiota bacterium]